MTNAKDVDPLDEARRKLDGVGGRPFDVDKILAQNRAKQERERESHKKAEEKLETAHKIGLERRNKLRAEELEETTETLQEKQQRFEDAKRLEAKKERHGAPKGGEEDTRQL